MAVAVDEGPKHQVLQAVFDYFQVHAAWPPTRLLELELDDSLNEWGGLQLACVLIGSDRILCGLHGNADVCRLRLRGLLECDRSEGDSNNLLSVFRYFEERYREARGAPDTLSTEEFVTVLGMTEHEARRACLLLEDATDVWDYATTPPQGWQTFRPAPFVRKLKAVRSLEDYLTRVAAHYESAKAAALLAQGIVAPPKVSSVFLCHAATDRELAELVRHTLGSVDTFMASRPGDIRPGEEWLESIQSALRKADAYVVLLTPNSLDRVWVWFETGAAWMSGRKLVPVTAGGLSVGEIPYPLAASQVYSLENPDEAAAVFRELGVSLTDPGGFSSEVRDVSGRAANAGIRDGGWLGVPVAGRFFAWDGPHHGLEDRAECFSPKGLEQELVGAGMRPFHCAKAKLPSHLAAGWLQVFETDRRRWRRVVLGNNESVLIVQPARGP